MCDITRARPIGVEPALAEGRQTPMIDVPYAFKVMGAIQDCQDAEKMSKVKTNFPHMKKNALSEN
jgi:hypothetical protein